MHPKTAARRLHQSRSAHKNQNPQNGHHRARFDWGFGAICFGASPVAAVFGSAPGSATPPEHRFHSNPSSQAATSKTGHFYFAGNRTFLLCLDMLDVKTPAPTAIIRTNRRFSRVVPAVASQAAVLWR